MENKFIFTFDNLKSQFETALNLGYQIITCKQYFENKKSFDEEKIIINRVDIDYRIKKTERIVALFNELGIKASFF